MASAKKTAPAKPAAPKKTAPAAPAAAKTEKAPKAPKEAKPKIERISANGVTRPKAGSQTGKVWDIADAQTAALPKGQYATRETVMEAAIKAGVNEATVATQYQRWRTFFAVPKAAPKPKAEKPAKEPKAPKAPKAPAKK